MTLRSTIMWLALTVAAGTALYVVKHQVHDLEDRLAVLDIQVQKDRDAIHVLHAEWAYVTQPARLAELVRNHLELVTPQPDQIVTSIERLPFALPTDEAPAGTLGGAMGPMTTARSMR